AAWYGCEPGRSPSATRKPSGGYSSGTSSKGAIARKRSGGTLSVLTRRPLGGAESASRKTSVSGPRSPAIRSRNPAGSSNAPASATPRRSPLLRRPRRLMPPPPGAPLASKSAGRSSPARDEGRKDEGGVEEPPDAALQ